MAKFKKLRLPKIATLIGQGTELLGDLIFNGGIHVDGTIKGAISGSEDGHSTLILSETGIIEGDVRVTDAVLNGTVVGDVYISERLELASHARIVGTVHYRLLEMARGAEVNGQLVRAEVIAGAGSEVDSPDRPADGQAADDALSSGRAADNSGGSSQS